VQFEEGAVVRGSQVGVAVHLTGRLDEFPKVDCCRTVDDRVHENVIRSTFKSPLQI